MLISTAPTIDGKRVAAYYGIVSGDAIVGANIFKDLFAGMPNPFAATRYHSLVIERSSLPDCLEVTAETDEGEIMGVRHKQFPIFGVQFHPESILTPEGKKLLANFLKQ